MNHPARAVATGLTLLAVVTGCTGPGTTTETPPAPVAPPVATPGPPALSPDERTEPAVPQAGDRPPTELAVPGWDVTVDDPAGPEPALRDLFLDDPPAGTGPDIALRFLQALQDQDDLAAARELFIAGRALLAGQDLALLHRVMRDVAGNARLDQAGHCTEAERLSADSALVTCGRQQVVVHVLDGPEGSGGVQINSEHPDRDVYCGPHTHAYTTIEL